MWTIPAARMKARKDHRVPLSDRCLAILRSLLRVDASPYVFPGARPSRPMSNMTLAKALKTAGADAYTVHGFRSTFRDWAGDRTKFPRELAEAALAHTVGDETERAYRRSDALDPRRELMNAWARFLEGDNANVTRLAGAG